MISKEKWAETIKNFQEKELPSIIERDINIPLEIPINRAVSIIGPRRAGKTFEMYSLISKIMKNAKKEQILYVNFEKADLGILGYQDLVVMLETFYELYPENKKNKIWLFLDEIQNVSNWEKFVRTALDENIKVYLSGSSSKLLSKEIATSMRGRSLTYSIFPFSFKEYLKTKGIIFQKYHSSYEKAKIVNLLKTYLEYGGYPEAVVYEIERERILTDINDIAIFKDVIERNKIRNTKAMKLLINALINSKEFSVNKFYNFLKSRGVKVGKTVLYRYTDYLNDAFFVFMLRKFSNSYKEAEQSIPKIYFIDNGLLRISGIQDVGRLMENLIFIELFKRGLNISYWKDIQGKEVDFVIKENKAVKQLIQSSYDVEDFNTKEREVKALLKASKELKCSNLIIINSNYEAEEKIKGKKIKFIPLWKWLLS
ncbi:ATP-binding protein [Candidatus Woesearchaeota archaeon]|nr:ATP-binding protein [Candidatus Woesearchaeota archaeon]